MNFAEALIDLKQGKEVSRKGVNWTLKLVDGKLFVSTTGGYIQIASLDNHNIIATDWFVVKTETYLTDLKPGDRFKAEGITGASYNAVFLKTSQNDGNGVENYFVNLSNGQSHQVIGKLKVEKVK